MEIERPAIDLYAGAGGATQGLLAAGFKVLAAVESDAAACESYAVNHPNILLFKRDIRSLDASEVRTQLGVAKTRLSLLTACPPCQGWSSLGHGDVTDPRNALVTDVWRFVEAFVPQAFLLENVTGLKADSRLVTLMAHARESGYAVRAYQVDAGDFGVPQRRKRLIVVGILRGSEETFPEHLSSILPESFDSQARAVDDIFVMTQKLTADSDSLHRFRRSTPTVQNRIQAIPVGGNRFDLPDEMRLTCHAKLSRREATSAYGRIRAGQPAPTMTTRCTTPACGQFLRNYPSTGYARAGMA